MSVTLTKIAGAMIHLADFAGSIEAGGRIPGGDFESEEYRREYEAIKASAEQLGHLAELVVILDDPHVLLNIPRPQRLRISEILHGSN